MLKIIGTTLAMGLMAATVVSAQSIRNTLPAAATPCILKEFKNVSTDFRWDPNRYSQFAKTQHQGKDYYLLGVFEKGKEIFHHLVVTVDSQNQCDVPFFNPYGEFMSFSPSVPEPVAQEFALQMIQRYVQELGGVQAYQKFLIRQAKESGGRLEWTPEERWAINRLGVRLPANIKIDGPAKPPN
jgi:hypothetical protein